MTHGVPKTLDRLTRQDTTRRIGYGTGHHHGQAFAALSENLFDCKDRRLGIERVENRFNQNQIDAAIEQAIELLNVRDA